ncbi:hypothetical protein DMA11_07850 [Marinilabiliaceae bacterium JC017]|nr:hypothetical protein DMA11_07850 [Marinilabiliaceae bacterium JC017]
MNICLVPVITDVVREIDGIIMMRCSYFSINSYDSLFGWNLQIRQLRLPILLLNLEAIIIGGPHGNGFNNPNDISAMYDSIEEEGNLFVDINDIWIPLTWFSEEEMPEEIIPQGRVYRIPSNLFNLCWQFRNDRIDVNELPELTPEEQLRHSDEETQFFAEWTNTQVEESRTAYQQNREDGLTLNIRNDE